MIFPLNKCIKVEWNARNGYKGKAFLVHLWDYILLFKIYLLSLSIVVVWAPWLKCPILGVAEEKKRKKNDMHIWIFHSQTRESRKVRDLIINHIYILKKSYISWYTTHVSTKIFNALDLYNPRRSKYLWSVIFFHYFYSLNKVL